MPPGAARGRPWRPALPSRTEFPRCKLCGHCLVLSAPNRPVFRPSATGSPAAPGPRQGSFRLSCRAATAGVEPPTPARGEPLPGQAGRAPPGAALDQAGAEGQAGEVGAAPAPGLVADAVQVRADRAHADVQLAGDLRIGVPPGDQGDQLPFPGAERVSRPGAAAGGAGPAPVSMRTYSAAAAMLIAVPRSSAARAPACPSACLASCSGSCRWYQPSGRSGCNGAANPSRPERDHRGPYGDRLGGAPRPGAQVPAAVQVLDHLSCVRRSAGRSAALSAGARRRPRNGPRSGRGPPSSPAGYPGSTGRPRPWRRPARRRTSARRRPGRRPLSARTSGCGCTPGPTGRAGWPRCAPPGVASCTAPTRSPLTQATRLRTARASASATG